MAQLQGKEVTEAHSKGAATYVPRRGLAPETNHAGAVVLASFASGTVRKELPVASALPS